MKSCIHIHKFTRFDHIEVKEDGAAGGLFFLFKKCRCGKELISIGWSPSNRKWVDKEPYVKTIPDETAIRINTSVEVCEYLKSDKCSKYFYRAFAHKYLSSGDIDYNKNELNDFNSKFV